MAGSRQIKVLSPNDGQEIGAVSLLASSEVQTVINLALQGQQKLKSIDHLERKRWLKALSQKITENAPLLAHLIALEGGKPLRDAQVEVLRAARTFQLCSDAVVDHGEQHELVFTAAAAQKKKVFTLSEPIGVVFALSAFNHPLNLLAHQVGTALAAGCAVIFKPSPSTPLCGEWLSHQINELGIPSGIAQIIHAEVPEIEALLAVREISFVSFIGAASVGWSLRAKLAPGTRLALEHGGTATAVISKTSDLELAASTLLKGAFYHAGQVCISTQKIFVHETLFEKFVQLFKAKAEALVVGDAREEKTDIGPMIRLGEKERALRWIKLAQADGAIVLLGDEVPRDGNFLGPHILTKTPQDSLVRTQEIFAPVVVVEKFSDISLVISEINQSRFHFAASLYSKDQQEIDSLIPQIQTMNLMVNDHTAWRVDEMPFGGHLESGLGMGGVKYAIQEQTRLKQVVLPK